MTTTAARARSTCTSGVCGPSSGRSTRGGSRRSAASATGSSCEEVAMSVQAGSRRTTYAGFSATLKLVGTGPRGSRDLTFEEARNAVRALMAGAATPAQAGAFLIATRVKGESGAELAGYVEGLREAVDRTVSVPEPGRPVVACAGAYDGCAEAPHLSLAAGVVAAACGAGIVIHCGPPVGPK